MRLARIESGHRPAERQRLRALRLALREEPSDVVKTCLYRPELFGAAYSDVFHTVMRGPSDWSVAERELFAAFVSSENQCLF